MNVTLKFYNMEKNTPEVKLTSDNILFLVGNELVYGHCHCNGFAYACKGVNRGITLLGVWNPGKARNYSHIHELPKIEWWAPVEIPAKKVRKTPVRQNGWTNAKPDPYLAHMMSGEWKGLADTRKNVFGDLT